MWNYIWPILLIVLSNAVYHIITKSTPSNASPFLSLTITYIIGAVITFALFRFSPAADKSLLVNLKNLNWTSYALGLAIIGLEVGYIYLYRQGWNISIGSLVANILLAVVLIAVGLLFYKEQLALKQVAGVVLCITGLILISF
jgi:drug/metabolite transporter (DMT)-like permease